MILAQFLETKTEEILLEIASKKMSFFDIDFWTIFCDVGSMLASKNHRKIAKFRKNGRSKASSESLLL